MSLVLPLIIGFLNLSLFGSSSLEVEQSIDKSKKGFSEVRFFLIAPGSK
jgi:hypothetical protein